MESVGGLVFFAGISAVTPLKWNKTCLKWWPARYQFPGCSMDLKNTRFNDTIVQGHKQHAVKPEPN